MSEFPRIVAMVVANDDGFVRTGKFIGNGPELKEKSTVETSFMTALFILSKPGPITCRRPR